MNKGMCHTCAGGRGSPFVPMSKRPAAAKAFFKSSKRRNILKRPVAGAIKPCAGASPNIKARSIFSERAPLSLPLKIVLNFKGNLSRLVPCDAQKLFSHPRNIPLHFEVFAMLLREPWIVDMLCDMCSQFDTEHSARPRMHGKKPRAEGLETKESF